MKIAVISDIHANLPALEAVYNHSIKQKVNALYCLGDLVNQNVWNNEVVEFIKYHQIPCVRGNHDEGIGNNNVKFSFSYGSREEFEWGREAIMFTMTQVTEQNKIFLRSLPLNIKLSVKTGGICGQSYLPMALLRAIRKEFISLVKNQAFLNCLITLGQKYY